MEQATDEMLIRDFGITPEVIEIVKERETELTAKFNEFDKIRQYNQYKVLHAFTENRVADTHFAWNTGYGYDDAGREVIEKVYASVFHTEAALVRPNIVNGTHALAITLMGILRPGDRMIYCSGAPYDTLQEVVGINGSGMGSLKEYGVKYSQVELKPDNSLDLEGVRQALSEHDDVKMVCVQRSTGYSWRNAISVDQIAEWAKLVHEIDPNIICMVDNCYGEFTGLKEPTDVGVDIMAGSLIKNPGGGLALTGGYVAGRQDLVDLISYRMTCPGIGAECGLMFGQTRGMLEGFFLSPSVVNAAMKGAALCGAVYKGLGYEVCPDDSTDLRSDIIESVKLGSPEAVVEFCGGIQAASPVESFVKPEPSPMPGYEDKVVMAAGAFVQGSSIEMSSDGPLRPPYIVYYQGGLTYDHARLGVMSSLNRLFKKGLLNK
ncbi:MAG: methionine gamma-lyase family protein [Eubacteriales bacterium]|nr:methionine gamma-lyase family protein [Eubacteriales bacterium]